MIHPPKLGRSFDCNTGNASTLALRLPADLRYRDGDNLRAYLDQLCQNWTCMAKHYVSSIQNLTVAIELILTMKLLIVYGNVKILFALSPRSQGPFAGKLRNKEIRCTIWTIN